MVPFLNGLDPTRISSQRFRPAKTGHFLSGKGFARKGGKVSKTRNGGDLGVVFWACLPASDAPIISIELIRASSEFQNRREELNEPRGSKIMA
jgi:hypothetical protein